MKDWEIAGAYFLPRILCWRTRNNTLPGKLHKPNLRYLSLSEDSQWTLWRSSDYFYPEMIPEPDYSDSGDEAGSENEEEQRRRFATDSRQALERLRDLTEVYVSNANPNKKTLPRKAPGKQAQSTSKTAPRQTPKTIAKATAPHARKSPPKPSQSRPPGSEGSRPTAAGAPSATVAKRSKSPPERKVRDPASSPKTQSPVKATGARQTKSPTKPTDIEATGDPKGTHRKSPPTARRASPKSASGAKASRGEKKEAAATVGDSKTRSTDSEPGDKSPPSVSGKSSPAEQFSDEDQLIKPRKPYAPSTEKQKLHKELKFSQKYGKLVPSKTELQLAIERYTENKVRRELDAEEKGSLEKILEQQAKKIEMQEAMDKYPGWLERLQRPPSTWPNPKTEEFYRVHARVVSNNILTHCFLPDNEGDLPPSQECRPCALSKTVLQSDSDS